MEKIDSIQKLTEYTKAEITSLHRVGPKIIQIIEKELKAKGLHFKLD